MEKLLYGYVMEDEEKSISNMMIYSSLEELASENNVSANDHIFVFQLVDQGYITVTPKFISNVKKAKK
jgi:hypothetical protein